MVLVSRLIAFVMIVLLCITILEFIVVYRQCGSQRESIHVEYKSNSVETNLNFSQTPTSTKRYLWCVNHYGPNNQLKDFIKCALIASMISFTLVTPPFFPHYLDVNKELQWFDHFYDFNSFTSIIDSVSIDEWIQLKKDSRNHLSIDCYLQQIEKIEKVLGYGKRIRQNVEKRFNIHIDFQRFINLSSTLKVQEVINKTENCQTVFLHIEYPSFRQHFETPHPIIQQIFAHLYRTNVLQRIAQQALEFLPQMVQSHSFKQNQSNIVAVTHFRLGDQYVMSPRTYVEQVRLLLASDVRFTHLHIMCVDMNVTDLEEITANLPLPFTTTKDLVKEVKDVLDEYLFDILEQEIAYQAPIFIGSPRTTYSATITMQKVFQDKGLVYLYDLKNRSSPYYITKLNARYFDL